MTDMWLSMCPLPCPHINEGLHTHSYTDQLAQAMLCCGNKMVSEISAVDSKDFVHVASSVTHFLNPGSNLKDSLELRHTAPLAGGGERRWNHTMALRLCLDVASITSVRSTGQKNSVAKPEVHMEGTYSSHGKR